MHVTSWDVQLTLAVSFDMSFNQALSPSQFNFLE